MTGTARGPPGQPEPAAGLGVADHVHVDVPGVLDHPGADALDQHPGQPGPPRGAEDELGGVDPAGELQQRGGHPGPGRVADDGVERRADVLGEAAQPGQRADRGAGEPVAAQHVHGEQLGRAGALGDPRRAAQHGLAFRAAGERHDHPFAGLPGLG